MPASHFFLPDRFVVYETMRASGNGGQGVNTTDSAVRARVNIWQLSMFTYEERRRIVEKLKRQLTADGDLLAKSQTTRSQLENKYLAKKRLEEIIRKACEISSLRIPTRPTRSSQERRLGEKKSIAKKKAHRKGGSDDERDKIPW